MARPRLWVHYCVASHTTRRYGPLPEHDLLGVSYLRPLPAAAEFPQAIRTLDLFVRFFNSGIRAVTVAVRVWRLDENGRNRERVAEYLFELVFDADRIDHDRAFRLVNIPVPEPGLYALRVCRPTRGGRWDIMGTEYLRVERP